MGRAALAVGVTFALALALAPELARRIEIGWLTCTSLLDEDADFVTASADRKVTDYAVVLGYALESDGAPTETLKERVRAGVALYLQGKTKRLLFSGGHPGGGTERRGNKSEAQVMATYATEIMKELEEEEEERRGSEGGGGGNKNLGNWNDFELEEKSTSTRTNALFSIRQIEESLFSGKHAAGQEAGEGERGRERGRESSYSDVALAPVEVEAHVRGCSRKREEEAGVCCGKGRRRRKENCERQRQRRRRRC